MKPIVVFGSTGSIGTQTLDIARQERGSFRVVGLSANRSHERLLEQVREFSPRFVALADPGAAAALEPQLPKGTTLLSGPEASEELARAADFEVAVNGVVGSAGLAASVAVLERGKTLALANKESLVVAGELLMNLAREHGAALVPTDSEHCAIFQCLVGERVDRVRRILLTASGGPFRETPANDLAGVTPQMALRHPNWDMGPRITVGSATMMNKALEIIEVHHLFGVERERIEVVVHPQSIVHSMVEFIDGSVIAQLGPPDMRGPIHYALHWPDRGPSDLRGFDLDLFRQLTFEAPDLERFPSIGLGFRCVEEGSDSGSVLNAADEVTVAAFLEGRIGFSDIARINGQVLEKRPGLDQGIEALLRADAFARHAADEHISLATARGASASGPPAS